jgi:hypothetical protein
MAILESDIRKMVMEETASFLASGEAEVFKDLLRSIQDEIKSGFQDLDLDLDLIYNALIGSTDPTIVTQMGQTVGGRAYGAKKVKEKGA